MTFSDITGPARTALIIAGVGFFITFDSYSSSTINGVRSCSYTDYAALVFGALAILFGAIAAGRTAGGPDDSRQMNMALSLGAVAIGGYHLLRGFGIIGGPC